MILFTVLFIYYLYAFCKILFYICSSVYGVCVCVSSVCVYMSEDNLWELVLSFHNVGSGDGTQVATLGSKWPYV